MFAHRTARSAGVAAGLVAFMAASTAAAQSLPGGSGIDYYPSWMHGASPYVSGADNDRNPLPGERFSRTDEDFQAWRAEQISRYGVDYYKRPGYEQGYDAWREVQGAGGNPAPAAAPADPVVVPTPGPTKPTLRR